MKALATFYAILTFVVSFTFDVWTGTAFCIAPLVATVGGAVTRVATERGDVLIAILVGGLLMGGGWAFAEWMQLTVDLFDVAFAAGWWTLGGAAIGFAAGPEGIV
jgi:hypothetical protein